MNLRGLTDDIEIIEEDELRAALAASSRHAEQAESSVREPHTKMVSVEPGDSSRMGREKSHFGRDLRYNSGRDQRRSASRVAGRGTRTVAPGHHGPLKHLVQVKKRNV